MTLEARILAYYTRFVGTGTDTVATRTTTPFRADQRHNIDRSTPDAVVGARRLWSWIDTRTDAATVADTMDSRETDVDPYGQAVAAVRGQVEVVHD